MRVYLRNAVVQEQSSTGRCYLHCSFEVDAEVREVKLEIVHKGNLRMLALDTWAWIDIISNEQDAFQKIRAWLFLALNGLQLPEETFVDV